MDKYIEEFSNDLRDLNLTDLEIVDVIIEDLEKYLNDLKKKRTKMINKNLDILYACRSVEV